jgi:low affinity Fe/Cu permease
LFGYSDTWQLVINTATTIITFLMVFVLQNTQNRDTAALHIKLDELIRVTQKARNVMLDLDTLDDKELERLKQDYARLAQDEMPAKLASRRGKSSAPKKTQRKTSDKDA